MADIKDQFLSGAVALDGNRFINVDFVDAQLQFGGGEAPSFDNCRFTQATFSFNGAASNTLLFLNAMAPAHTNMRDVVLGLIPALKD